jgi:hypothetical protein
VLTANHVVDAVNGATEVVVGSFTAKATVDKAIIKTVNVVQQYSSATAPSTVKLYDGSTLVGSGTASGLGVVNATGTTAFSNLSIEVPVDTTKILTIKVDYPATYGGSVGENATVGLWRADVAANGVWFQRGDGVTAAATMAGATTWGNTQYTFRSAPLITLVSTSAVKSGGGTTASSQLATTIVLKMKAQNGTLVAPGGVVASAAASITVAYLDPAPAELKAASGTPGYSVTLSPAKATYADGEEVTVTIAGNMVYEGPTVNVRTPTFFRLLLASLWWRVGNTSIVQNWGLQDFVTPYVSLP